MKKLFLLGLTLLCFIPSSTLFAQGKVYVSDQVLKTADWAGLKYRDAVKRAIAGDGKSIEKLFDFARLVDGTEGIQHAVTCLEIIPLATDEKVARNIYLFKPKLKKLILDRISLAQGRTQKEALKKPFNTWAPITWDVLNNRPLPAPKPTEAEMAQKMNGGGAIMDVQSNDAQPSAKSANQLAPAAGRGSQAAPTDQLAPAQGRGSQVTPAAPAKAGGKQ